MNGYCFIIDHNENYVYITRTDYFDSCGYLKDCHLTCEIPDFLSEAMESTYESDIDLDDARNRLLSLGFEERFLADSAW